MPKEGLRNPRLKKISGALSGVPAAAYVLVSCAVLALCLFGFALFSFLTPDEELYAPTPDDAIESPIAGAETVERPDLGISFRYEAKENEGGSGAGGYLLLEPDLSEYNNESLRAAFILMPARAYEEMQNSDVPREAPPSIRIFVFNNPDDLDPKAFAEAYDEFSNLSLANSSLNTGGPDEVSLRGVPAFHYIADGLYALDTYVAVREGKAYIITGGFADASDPIRFDFKTLLDSIQWLQ